MQNWSSIIWLAFTEHLLYARHMAVDWEMKAQKTCDVPAFEEHGI